MKIIVTGAGGRLGSAVVSELTGRGHECVGTVRMAKRGGSEGAETAPAVLMNMDITDKAEVDAVFKETAPDAVIHCAAWTDVDGAETEEGAKSAYDVNVRGTENVAKAAKNAGAKMIYVSTDYVYGNGETGSKKPVAPLNIYGKTKLEGEKKVMGILKEHFIVRTSWLYGPDGGDFAHTMLRIGREGGETSVVDDQTGRPTYAPDLAVLLADMVETDRYGIYEASGEGEPVSWCGFANEIFRQAGTGSTAVPVTSRQYEAAVKEKDPTRIVAERPHDSMLDTASLKGAGFGLLPDWKDALARYLAASEAGRSVTGDKNEHEKEDGKR